MENSHDKLQLEELTKSLSRRASSGDVKARKELIEFHLSLARYYGNKYARFHPHERADIEQCAYVGLCRAVDGYDPEANNAFSTYAVWLIKSEIRAYLRGLSVVRVNQGDRTKLNVIERYVRNYRQKNHDNPSDNEIAIGTGIKVSLIPEILAVREASAECSRIPLDNPDLPSKLSPLHDCENAIYSEANAIARRVLKITQVLLILNDNERRVIIERFELAGHHNCSRRQLAKEFGCSQKHIEAIEQRALQKIRKFITHINREREKNYF